MLYNFFKNKNFFAKIFVILYTPEKLLTGFKYYLSRDLTGYIFIIPS